MVKRASEVAHLPQVQDRDVAEQSLKLPAAFSEYEAAGDLLTYQIDFWQRSVLYLDTLRQRANNMIEHERAGKPPVLDFDYQVILDGYSGPWGQDINCLSLS